MTEPEGNNWPVWAKHVLSELERLGEEMGKMRLVAEAGREKWNEEISKLRVEVALLKFKCSLFGAGAGVLTALATALVGRLAGPT